MRLLATTFVFLAGCLAAFAQAPRAPAPPDPALQQAKAAFESLDLEQRKSIQRDLVWAGGFQGAATGEFGALTFAAIRRFETAAKLPITGQMSPEKRAALTKAADAGRVATGFRIEADRATGMKIGVPTKLFTKRSTNGSGSDRWQEGGDKATLDLLTIKGEDDLPALFEKGTDAKVAGRKITYKLLRPDFFVIAGETEKGKFYRRVEKNEAGLRGFSIGYDKGIAATLDPLVIAMSSTFEAVPGKGTPAGPAIASGPLANPNAGKPRRVSGILVAPGKVVTSEMVIKSCRSLAVDGRARMMAAIEKTEGGLALLNAAVPGAEAVALATVMGAHGLLLQRDLDGKLLASPAELAGRFATVPLQEGGAGAGIFDMSGLLLGIITAEPVTKYAIAGVIPMLRNAFVPADEIARFAGVPLAAGAAPQPGSAGDIAAKRGSAVVSIFCGS